MVDLTNLTKAVADNKTAIDAAVTLIKGLETPEDPKPLQDLVDSLAANTTELTNAITTLTTPPVV